MENKEFVPYKESLALKELGFDEECVAFYKGSKYIKSVDQHWGMSISGISKKASYEVSDLILTPLYQQAFRWFREKYELNSYIRHECPEVEPYYDFVIGEEVFDAMLETYEEAELACLNKLIEIAQKE